MKKIISVTADDIKAGERTNRFKCPVARAIQRQTRKKFVSVAFRYVCIDGVLYRLPKRVTPLFVAKPFTFKIGTRRK